MKLLRCYKCGDMVALRTWVKSCKCGECFGKFLCDNRTIIVYPSRFVQVLGVDTDLFEPITYMVSYQKFDKNKPIDEETELIKRKWIENPELGIFALAYWFDVPIEEIDRAIKGGKIPVLYNSFRLME